MLVSSGEARFLEVPGKPLGLFDDYRLESGRTELPPDASLALFSDGLLEVIEAPSVVAKEAELLARVRRVADASPSDIDALCRAFGLSPALEAPDDIACLLVARVA